MLLFLELLIYIDNNKNINNITSHSLFYSILFTIKIKFCECERLSLSYEEKI